MQNGLRKIIFLWLFFWAFVPGVASAKTLRQVWIPQAVAPAEDACRYELEELFSAGRRPADLPGQFFDYGVAYQCHVSRFGAFDVEAGLDYRDSWDVQSSTLWDPLQINAQLTYGGHKEESGWSAAVGVQGVGIHAGQNNFNMIYGLGETRAGDWELSVGAYTGNKDVLKAPDGSAEATGALAGVRRYIGRGSVSAEFTSGRNRYGYLFLGANVKFSETLTGALAYGIANERSVMRDWVLVRLVMQ